MSKPATKRATSRASTKPKLKPSQRTARRDRASARQDRRASKTRKAMGFDAGQNGRRLRAVNGTALAINTQIRQYGKTVLRRSRYLAVNNPYASAAKEEYVSALVGAGIKPSSLVTDKKLKAAIVELWNEWTDEADADGLTDYYGLQSIVAAEMFEAGECFVRMRPRFASDGLSVPLQLQILPSEMVPTDYNIDLGSGRRIECGIQFSAIGLREGYWFYRRHPGEQFAASVDPSLLSFVPADEVMHLFKPIRAGQIRGLPHTLAGMVTLAMIDLYDDAELERKRIAALFGAFITRPRNEDDEEHPLAGTVESLDPDSNFSLEPGAVIDLAEGQDVHQGDQDRADDDPEGGQAADRAGGPGELVLGVVDLARHMIAGGATHLEDGEDQPADGDDQREGPEPGEQLLPPSVEFCAKDREVRDEARDRVVDGGHVVGAGVGQVGDGGQGGSDEHGAFLLVRR